jgi:hypothetical protein
MEPIRRLLSESITVKRKMKKQLTRSKKQKKPVPFAVPDCANSEGSTGGYTRRLAYDSFSVYAV